MTTRLTRMSVALCAALAMLLATAAMSHAATGTTTIQYGPYTIPAGNGDPHGHHDGMGMIENQLTLNVARPFAGQAGTITGMKANLVYADGSTVNWNTEAMLHHMVLLASGTGRADATCPGGFGGVSGSQFTERIFASGNERTPVDFTGSPYGEKLAASDQLHIVADLMNIKTSPQTVYITVEYKWATGTDSTAKKDVKPVWLDVDGCGDSEFNAPFGLSDQVFNVASPVTGGLVGAAGHLHDHSLNLQVQNTTRGGDMCTSLPGFGETPGYIDTSQPTGRKRISSMTPCYGNFATGSPAAWVRQGDNLRMHARYYAGPEHSHAVEGAMGIMIAYFDTTLTPPATTGLPTVNITSPADNSTGTANQVSVGFSTSGATSTTCKINRAAPVACSSPVSVASLLGTASVADGAYTVQVTATNATGSRTSTVSFAVDTLAPVITIPEPTEGQVLTSGDVEVHLLISDANVFTANCSLDGAPATDCTVEDGHGHIMLTGLANGTHTFRVNATDTLGHASQLVRTFSVSTTPPVDTTAPSVSISSPANGSTSASSSVTLNFTATDNVGVTGTTCAIDGGAPVACTTGRVYSGLANGSHTISVAASDAAGNVGSSSTTFTVNVVSDTQAPVVSITSPTAGQVIRGSSVTVNFTATDNVGVTSRTCQLSGPTSSAEAACTSPKTYSNLARGSYTVTVRARDAAGNVGVATRSFSRR